MALRAVSNGTGRVRSDVRGGGATGPAWFEDPSYSNSAAVADWENQRWAVTNVSLANVSTATTTDLRSKRAATFVEWLTFTAPSTTARTYIDVNGVLRNDLAVDVPRLTYANNKRQLRLEDARTNVALQSNTFSNASWVKQNSTVTGPDAGGWWALAETATTNYHRMYQDVAGSSTNSLAMTASVDFKTPTAAEISAGAATHAAISLSDQATGGPNYILNLATGGVTVGPDTVGSWTGNSVAVTALPNAEGWRLKVTGSRGAAVGSAGTLLLIYSATSSAINYAGTLGRFVSFRRAQLEYGAFASDYIPTTTAAVTRAVETAQLSLLLEAVFDRAGSTLKDDLGADVSLASGSDTLLTRNRYHTRTLLEVI